MAHALNIVQHHYRSVLLRQLEHRRVQLFLELGETGLPAWCLMGNQGDEFGIMLGVEVEVVEAQVRCAIPSRLKVVEAGVVGNAIYPGVETGVALETPDRLPRL